MGIANGGELVTEHMKIHGCNQGLSLTLPPMGVIYLRYEGERKEADAQAE